MFINMVYIDIYTNMTNNRPTQNLKQNVFYLLFIYQSGASIQVYNVYMYSK